MDVNFEQIIQHSNQNKNFIASDIASLAQSKLTWKESEKKWSVLEVIDHLRIVYDLYEPNFKKALENAPKKTGSTQVQKTLLGRLSIFSQQPKGRKRRFKMKTFDFFQPAQNTTDHLKIINTYLERKNTFNELIKLAREHDIRGLKIPTALGDKVKFYLPECFEFLLAHEDRHLVQIQDILNKVK